MGDRQRISWLFRRAAFGLAPGQLDELEALGLASVLDQLVDGAAHGLAPAPDPWAGVTLTFGLQGVEARQQRQAAVRSWLDTMVSTSRPLEEWMRWFWHGHLVSSLNDVPSPALMVQQLRTYGQLGMRDVRSLLQAATVDPAMLMYLNGDGSDRRAPNENYSRELLELFALGLGAYTEDDVKAGAAALTGYRVNRRTGSMVFDPRAQDTSPQRFLDVEGVVGVEAVIDAVTGHRACPRWIVRCLAEAILGVDVDGSLIDDLARTFEGNGMQIRPLVGDLLRAGLDGASQPTIISPVVWLTSAARATGAPLPSGRNGVARILVGAGQLPLFPPNVSGWPRDRAWLSSSATVARFNGASLLAAATPDGAPPLTSAAAGDVDALADSLGRPEGFSESTRRALDDLGEAREARPGEAALAVALASPDMVQG